VCWSTDSQLFVGGEDGDVLVWDRRALAEPSHTLSGHKDSIRRVAVTESVGGEAVLVSASDDCTVAVRALSRLDQAETVLAHTDYVRALCCGKGLIVTGSWDKKVARIQVA
jgi:WD40 repeat protein